MTEKQSSATEIQWTMVKPSINAGEQANRLLSQALPPDVAAHFATMRIANNRYITSASVSKVKSRTVCQLSMLSNAPV